MPLDFETMALSLQVRFREVCKKESPASPLKANFQPAMEAEVKTAFKPEWQLGLVVSSSFIKQWLLLNIYIKNDNASIVR